MHEERKGGGQQQLVDSTSSIGGQSLGKRPISGLTTPSVCEILGGSTKLFKSLPPSYASGKRWEQAAGRKSFDTGSNKKRERRSFNKCSGCSASLRVQCKNMTWCKSTLQDKLTFSHDGD